MFFSIEEGIEALAALGAGGHTATLQRYFRRTFVAFETDDESVTLLRLGGGPRLSDEFEVPARGPLPHAEQMSRFGADVAHAWVSPCELSYLAELDLSRLRERFGVEPPLPESGRLHFFWDPYPGCYGQERLVTRVLHETGDHARRSDRELRESERPGEKGPDVYPRSTWDLRVVWTLPDAPLLAALLAEHEPEAANFVTSIFHGDEDAYDSIWPDHGDEVRVSGWSSDVQNSPFIDAELIHRNVVDVPVRWPEQGDFTPEVIAAALDWVLLLQVTFTALRGELDEGTVYFVARRERLDDGDLSGAFGLYQQT